MAVSLNHLKSFDGVFQGDALAPFLFAIVLDWVMHQATVDNPGFAMIPRQSRRHPEYKLSNLGYADDIVLLLLSIGDAQQFFDRRVLAAANVGSMTMPPKPKFWFIIDQGHLHSASKQHRP